MGILTKLQITQLLQNAEAAHAKYEEELGTKDDNWADWYAGHIQLALSKLEDLPLNESQLAASLRSSAEMMGYQVLRRQNPNGVVLPIANGKDWADEMASMMILTKGAKKDATGMKLHIVTGCGCDGTCEIP